MKAAKTTMMFWFGFVVRAEIQSGPVPSVNMQFTPAPAVVRGRNGLLGNRQKE